MTSIAMSKEIFTHVNAPIFEDMQGLNDFKESQWFWKEVQQRKLLRFLEFAQDSLLVGVAQNLLYAYTYSGTLEALIRLCMALFGSDAIVVADESEPAVLNMKIENANINFLYAIADGEYTLSVEKQFALRTVDLSRAVSYDPLQFFRNFMTPGRVLKALDIEEQKDAYTNT